ncbi:MAG TPA: aspartyl/asparaginyl beta-hydroxylase domain-containing protein [Caulobacteraceae bacterium]|jgi:aspartyl/asparaginyl beta-hydroxylase (cupin superfamily)
MQQAVGEQALTRGAGEWLGLAQARRAEGDVEGQRAALDEALKLEPRNVRALLLKARDHEEAGERVKASAFYQAALKAAPPPHQLPADLVQELGRAQQMTRRYAGEFEAAVRERVASAVGSAAPGSRAEQSLDILFGRKRVYLQEPRSFYFPGLPQIQFYHRAEFPWMDRVEAATEEIRGELLEVLREEGAFTPYIQERADAPPGDLRGMLNNPDWSAFFLVKEGALVPANAARCPKTLAAVEAAPLARLAGRSPSVLFSLLKPGARIPPHNGMINTRLICHLPLIVPEGCGFRVGNDVRQWREGKAWAFDDTIEHEAWNNGDQMRFILIFDIWRPEMTQAERELVGAVMEAIDAVTGAPPEWDI